MAFVPVPANTGGYQKNITQRGEYVWTWPNGKVYTTPLSCTIESQKGSAGRSKGKPVKYKGTKWSPCRSYTRGAMEISLSGSLRAFRPAIFPNEFITYNNVPWINNSILTPESIRLPYRGNNLLPVPMSVNTQNRLVTECLQKVNDRKINLGEALAESRQSISMIARRSIQLVRALLALRRLKFRDFFLHLGLKPKKVVSGKLPADLWLEYQYGWKPLMSDIYQGYQTFRDGLQRPQLIRAVRRLSESGDVTVNSRPGFQVTGTANRYDQCILFYEVQDSYLNTFSQIGLINPLEVAWAVVPFSFVVDWFLPVQSVLEACTATVGLTFRDGCFTTKATMVAQGRDTAIGSGWYLDPKSDLTYIVDWTGFTRTVITSSPVPGLYIRDPFSSTHAANALALLRQLRR